MVKSKQNKRNIIVAIKWYDEVTSPLLQLYKMRKKYLSDADLRGLGICLSDLDLEKSIPDCPPNADSLFFQPLPEESMQISSCAATCPDAHLTLPGTKQRKKDRKYADPYSLSRDLKAAISLHEAAVELVYPSSWKRLNFRTEYQMSDKWTSNHADNKPCHFFGATSLQSEDKPHLVLRLLTDCSADERLTRSELITLVSFIHLGINTQILKYRRKPKTATVTCKQREYHVKIPILLVSILNPARIRIVQACYDGMLKIKRSRLYNFDVPCHEAVMDLFIRWMKGRPCGNTCLRTSLGAIQECAVA